MLRYWDGTQWTDHWELAGTRPLPPTGQPALWQPPKKKSNAGKVLLIVGSIVAVFIVIAVIAGAMSSSDSSNDDAATTTLDSEDVEALRTQAAAASASKEAAARAAAVERARLTDKSNYQSVSSREWQLVAKNPDQHVGDLYVIYGRVVQADAATGSTQIRVSTDGQQVEAYDFDINTIVTAGQASFAEVVEDDLVTLWVKVAGSQTYETTMGGSVTAPEVQANVIEVYGSAD